MNRVYLLIFSFLLFIVFLIPQFKMKIIDIANYLKEQIVIFEKNIEDEILFFKSQKRVIEDLKKENETLKNKIANLESIVANCKDFKKFNLIKTSNLYLVKTLLYAALPDYTKIYVNYPKSIKSLKGLVYNNLAAGIVVKNYGKYSLALLNSNSKTSYAVMIGENEIPGIFKGKENIIKYIPKYEKIRVGDIVKTSGLDGVFYKGALVGKITKVFQKKLYQEAKIKLFYNKLTPNYFYVVEKNVTIKKRGGKNGNKSN